MCGQALLEHGASLSARNGKFETAAQVAGHYDGKLTPKDRLAIRKTLYGFAPRLRTLVLQHPECLMHVTEDSHQVPTTLPSPPFPARVSAPRRRFLPLLESPPLVPRSLFLHKTGSLCSVQEAPARIHAVLRKLRHQKQFQTFELDISDRFEPASDAAVSRAHTRERHTCPGTFVRLSMSKSQKVAA